jgi:glyoxylase-like metal-dependent hydrolase (beta-lactamase superfamily II)
MILKPVVPNVYAIPLGFVNAFLVDSDGLTLIDTGIKSNGLKIVQAIIELGKKPADVRRILVTHCHADHTGSLSMLARLTGAPVYMHLLDADMVRSGRSNRTIPPGPGLAHALVRVMMKRPGSVDVSDVNVELQDGQSVDSLPSMTAVHTPGHTAGHLCFLWQAQGGVLFVGDAATHQRSLSAGPIYENLADQQRSLAKLAALHFETACFAHGSPILNNASTQFARFLPAPAQ